MGKNIGGTIGAPFEFKRQKNNVNFYTQTLDGNPLPNDDLDIQLLWLIALEEKGLDLDARLLGEYWMLYVTPHWAEYGIAKINMKSGLMPPLSGTVNNTFKDSNGAFIRSEIWACIAPGCPQTAAAYAYEDAIIDHGNGEGVYAEVFCAALESAAFVESNIDTLIEIGLSYIPVDCGVTQAVKRAIDCYKNGLHWEEAREELLRNDRGQYAVWGGISPEDEAKGFKDGKLGWDAPINIGIIILALLYSEGDFDKMICTAVNCGEDTDCTAATLGSLYGILYGIEAIPQRWIDPIGMNIRTACLNLGELGVYGDQLPATIQNLTDRVTAIAKQMSVAKGMPLAITVDKPTDWANFDVRSLYDNGSFRSRYNDSNGCSYKFDFFDVHVDYGQEGPVIQSNHSKTMKVTIRNKYKISQMLNIRWYGPADFQVSPASPLKLFSTFFPTNTQELEFTIELGALTGTNRLTIEIIIDGTHTVMLVPVILLHMNN